METNQLFKELKSDPRKVTGDIARDLQKSTQYAANRRTFEANSSSIYMSSIHGATEGTDARSTAANSIANDFLKDLASGFGVPAPSSGLSAIGTSTDGISRRGTVQPYSPSPDITKHKSEYSQKRNHLLKPSMEEEDVEADLPPSHRENATNLQVKKSSGGGGGSSGQSTGQLNFDQAFRQFGKRGKEQRSVTFADDKRKEQ